MNVVVVVACSRLLRADAMPDVVDSLDNDERTARVAAVDRATPLHGPESPGFVTP